MISDNFHQMPLRVGSSLHQVQGQLPDICFKTLSCKALIQETLWNRSLAYLPIKLNFEDFNNITLESILIL